MISHPVPGSLRSKVSADLYSHDGIVFMATVDHYSDFWNLDILATWVINRLASPIIPLYLAMLSFLTHYKTTYSYTHFEKVGCDYIFHLDSETIGNNRGIIGDAENDRLPKLDI